MQIRSKVGRAWILVVASASLCAPAMAQDSAASEALFNKGVADMEAGRYEAGCPALAESHRLEPRAGTMFALAECEVGWGHLASAVVHYSDYVGMVSRLSGPGQARHRARVKTSEAQLAKLRPQVPQLSLALPANAPRDTIVKRDGVVLKGVSLGMALPVDPGEHLIITQVPGGPEHAQRITIKVGETKRLELELEMPKAAAAPPVDAAEVPTRGSAAEAPAAEPTSSSTRTWAYVAGGIGVAGIAAGTVTGLMSMSKKKTADDNCDGSVCNQEGLTATDDGKMLGTISTTAFGVGIAGLTTGVILWFAAPPTETREAARPRWSPTAVAGSDGAVVGLRGSW